MGGASAIYPTQIAEYINLQIKVGGFLLWQTMLTQKY